MIYPSNFEEKIKFNRIRQLVKDKCASTLGSEWVEKMRFSTSFEEVMVWLKQTQEFVGILTNEDEYPSAHFIDVRDALKKIRVEGLFLEEKELFDLRKSLASIRDLIRFFSSKSDELYPELKKLSSGVTVYPVLFDRIDHILNKFGKIKDNASPDLSRIRNEILSQQNSISRKMQSILRKAKAEGLIDEDVSVSIRDGRAVIPVPSPNKRKLGGIIHDESATGKTTFIEPAEIVEINNQLRELEYAERREIIRILTDITNLIRPYLPDLFYSYDYLGWIDFIGAKARLAIDIKGTLPAVSNQQDFIWDNAIHPLLYIQHQSAGLNVVPLDLELNQSQRLLVISGPNAGGKSVCLQTVGLLQYMLQSGLLVSMSESSKMGFFHQLFIDMGDEQSIENDLSTYSSHLTNMKHFVRQCNHKTLILIDEFGTGTEPMLGGAIAESVLSHLNHQGVYGVITTHYTNLKHFAAQTDGIINGAMLFDTHAIQPLFKLEMGKPGSSFAFEIAHKIGLPETILTDAKSKIGQEHFDYDKHLREIARDKRYWEQKRQAIRSNEKKLEEILAKYQTELEKVNQEKKEIIRQAKAEAAELLRTANQKIENTIREIRESQAEKEKTRLSRHNLTSFKEEVETFDQGDHEKIERKIRQIKDREKRKEDRKLNLSEHPLVEPMEPAIPKPFTKGDFVKLEGQEIPGEIIEVQGKNALVAFGQIKTTVKIERLVRISKNAFKKEVRQMKETVATPLSDRIRARKLTFKADIDVRGKRAEEALQLVMNHIDDAIICETHSLKILHGKGNGILRMMIREYLSSVNLVKNFHDEHVQFGGSGITIVELDL